MMISYQRFIMIVLNLFAPPRARERMKHQHRSASKPRSIDFYRAKKELDTLNVLDCLDVCQCRSRLYPKDPLTTTAAVWVEGSILHLSKRTEPAVESTDSGLVPQPMLWCRQMTQVGRAAAQSSQSDYSHLRRRKAQLSNGLKGLTH